MLIADQWVSRGWEANHVLVVDFDGSYGIENLGGWVLCSGQESLTKLSEEIPRSNK